MPLAAALVLPLLFGLAGCAGGGHQLMPPHPESLPFDSPLRLASLAPGDAWLRHHLMFGRPDSALAVLAPGRGLYPSDELLKALQESIVLRQAGDYRRSNERLEWADHEAERRYSRSLTRTVGSFIINDRVLPYTPSAGEQAMIPYYRMMNYLALGDLDGAAVEARRISALLGGFEAREVRRCAADGMLQYLTGLVFDAAGEDNDALVAVRRAEESFDSCDGGVRIEIPEAFGRDLGRLATRLGVSEVADSARSRYAAAFDAPSAGTGEVVLLLERGFIAHLTEESIHVPILDEETEGLESGDSDGIGLIAAAVTARLLESFADGESWGHRDDGRSMRRRRARGGAHILRLAWPALRHERHPAEPLRVLLDADTIRFSRVGDISAIAADELEEGRVAAMPRLVARGITKYLLSREVEKRAERRGGDFLGFVTGRLANLAANESERADLRSWTLLPNEISMARLTLPEGIHALRVQVVSDSGPAGILDMGVVEVRAGRLTVLNRRLWSNDLAPDTVAAATAGS